jgi:hypothetical protein
MLRPVRQRMMARADLKAYFEARIKEVVKPEEIRIEELALRKLGFAPPDFDLKTTTVDLMSEQAAAFYDYRKKVMVLLEDRGGMMEEMALTHELAHALADQHFHLDKFLKKAGGSDDSSLARMAVMEGQATWLMSEHVARGRGQSLKDDSAMVEMMARMAASGGGGFPVFEKAPLYMRESLVFPYAQGMRFQHQLYLRYGQKSFGEAFLRPPESTREVLHPEVYFSGEKPRPVKAPEPPRPKEWKLLAEGTTGEFDHQVLLKQYLPEEVGLAPLWRGGVYALWENKKDRERVALAYASEWEDAAAAQAFLKAWRTILEKKWKKATLTLSTDARLAGRGDDGYFQTVLEGTRIRHLEGLAAEGASLR